MEKKLPTVLKFIGQSFDLDKKKKSTDFSRGRGIFMVPNRFYMSCVDFSQSPSFSDKFQFSVKSNMEKVII